MRKIIDVDKLMHHAVMMYLHGDISLSDLRRYESGIGLLTEEDDSIPVDWVTRWAAINDEDCVLDMVDEWNESQ